MIIPYCEILRKSLPCFRSLNALVIYEVPLEYLLCVFCCKLSVKIIVNKEFMSYDVKIA